MKLYRLTSFQIIFVWVFLITILSYFTFCASSFNATQTKNLFPQPQDINRIKHINNATTFETLVEGYVFYKENCGNADCHRLYLPTEYDQEEWEDLLPDMLELTKQPKPKQEKIFLYIYSKAPKEIHISKEKKDTTYKY